LHDTIRLTSCWYLPC